MTEQYAPLASKMRPRHIDEFIGQSHLLAPGKPLRLAIEHGHLHSMILWGPPGCGKTTLARLLADRVDAHIEQISAVLAGVKDIRLVVEHAKQLDRKTVLFVDEVHRFNKAQQDAFLPYVEDGTIILIGATTENPSFALNNALLSRARVYVLRSLQPEDLKGIVTAALHDERGYGGSNLQIDDSLLDKLVLYADGDARQILNMLEIAVDFAEDGVITESSIEEMLQGKVNRFDKGGDLFYEQISALHKSVRGSNPDAALYWLSRMLTSGCDPHYVARRVLRMAAEDIGNADPRALTLALSAWQTYERLGSPEGEIAIAQAVVYMACCAKSNAVYTAFNEAWEDAKAFGSLDVPMHLRNAPTKMMKNMGYGQEYRYAHDEKDAYAAGVNYFPEEMPQRQYYQPVDRGLEIKIKEKLASLRKLDNMAD